MELFERFAIRETQKNHLEKKVKTFAKFGTKHDLIKRVQLTFIFYIFTHFWRDMRAKSRKTCGFIKFIVITHSFKILNVARDSMALHLKNGI